MKKEIKSLIIAFGSTEWRNYLVLGKFIDSLNITDIETQYFKHKNSNKFEDRQVAHNIEITFKSEAKEDFLKKYGHEGFTLFGRLSEKDIQKITITIENTESYPTALEKYEREKIIYPIWEGTYENKYQSVERDAEGYITLKITDFSNPPLK